MSLEAPGHAVDELLDGLAEALEGDADRGRLDELGDQAEEIVSTTDLSEIVAAIGLGEDDAHPQSLPAAVAAGEPKTVASLRSLLTASKLPTADEEQTAQLVDELGSLVETAQTEPPDESESSNDADSDAAEPTDTAPDEESASTDDDSTDSEEAEAADSDSSIRQLLESQLQETLDIFDGGSESELGLESLTDTFTEDDETADGAESSDEPSDETSDKTADEETDESTQSRDGTRWHPGGRGRTTHSTIPTAGRRDIGRSGQFSTIRGSTVSKR